MREKDRKLAVRVAKSMLDGSMPILLGCHRLRAPLLRMQVHMDEAFRSFIAVDSETHLPLEPEERKLWMPSVLIEKDKEVAELTAWAKDRMHVLKACQAVIDRFGHTEQK